MTGRERGKERERNTLILQLIPQCRSKEALTLSRRPLTPLCLSSPTCSFSSIFALSSFTVSFIWVWWCSLSLCKSPMEPWMVWIWRVAATSPDLIGCVREREIVKDTEREERQKALRRRRSEWEREKERTKGKKRGRVRRRERMRRNEWRWEREKGWGAMIEEDAERERTNVFLSPFPLFQSSNRAERSLQKNFPLTQSLRNETLKQSYLSRRSNKVTYPGVHTK